MIWFKIIVNPQSSSSQKVRESVVVCGLSLDD
jgi:hypothetical protein